MAAQHTPEGDNSTRYNFNAKELDQSTRTVLLRFALLRPKNKHMAEKYHAYSSYNNLIDPDEMRAYCQDNADETWTTGSGWSGNANILYSLKPNNKLFNDDLRGWETTESVIDLPKTPKTFVGLNGIKSKGDYIGKGLNAGSSPGLSVSRTYAFKIFGK